MIVELDDGAPNSDFYFVESNFLEYFNEMNDTTLQYNTHKLVGKNIKDMKDDEIKVESSVYVKVMWKIIESILDDEMITIIEKRAFSTKKKCLTCARMTILIVWINHFRLRGLSTLM